MAIAIGSCHTLPSNALIAQVIAVCVVQLGLEALKHCMWCVLIDLVCDLLMNRA